ncbi:MAG TPA: NAD(P) transhydrogenase subunit alpha [Micromonosporaceae bacterium]|nr:NAD(P) transhydrogenase subunit alpha [Micromonosporaceae bacterium]
MALKVAAIKETAAGERRVALTPEAVGRLKSLDIDVLVETGAGAASWFPDEAYEQAGANVMDGDEVRKTADVLVSVGQPAPATIGALRPGQVVIGLLRPLTDPGYAADLAAAGVTAISLDGLPRTVSRAQSMDVLSSQASVAGYRAALLAASVYDRYFPLLVTAAGTARPAEVLVLGAGVAGLQAIATVRRLGAVVRAYDVRPASAAEVESLGAQFLRLTSVAGGAGEGGYARALTAEEQQAQQAELMSHIAKHNVVITTAQVPGRRPPLLVTEAAVAAMSPGSVVVDLGASEFGGNVAGSRPDETVVTANGVTIVGAGNLAADAPGAASAAYSRNVCALLTHLVHDGELAIDLTDEIQAGIVITHDGAVVHAATNGALNPIPAGTAGEPSDQGRAG